MVVYRENRHVTDANKYCFWLAFLAGVAGAGMGAAVFSEAGLAASLPMWPVSGIYLGLVIADGMFLSTGRRSYGLTACCYAVLPAVLLLLMQLLAARSDSEYIRMSILGAPSLIANVWAMVGAKKQNQDYDASLGECLSLKAHNTRILTIALYALTALGLVLAVVGAVTGTLPKQLLPKNI